MWIIVWTQKTDVTDKKRSLSERLLCMSGKSSLVDCLAYKHPVLLSYLICHMAMWQAVLRYKSQKSPQAMGCGVSYREGWRGFRRWLGEQWREGKALEVSAMLTKDSGGSEPLVIMTALAGATCLHPVSCGSLPVGPYPLLGSPRGDHGFLD